MAPARQRRYYPLHRLASLAASCRGADCVGWTMPIGRLRIKRSIIGMLRQRRNALLALKSKDSLILHSLLSVGVGLLACIAVTKGAHRYFQKLNYIVSSIESISENISNKYIYYYESLFDAGVNSNIIAIEVFLCCLGVFSIYINEIIKSINCSNNIDNNYISNFSCRSIIDWKKKYCGNFSRRNFDCRLYCKHTLDRP